MGLSRFMFSHFQSVSWLLSSSCGVKKTVQYEIDAWLMTFQNG